MAERISCITFPGGTNLPIWVGQSQGFFEARGVSVDLHYTNSSKEQLAGLIHGDYDLGHTAIDNVVAYQEGQGEAEIRVEPDLFVFMGGDDAFLRLVVQKDIQSFADLKGRTLSVDALTTGFAFVLRKMIERAGLSEDDVSYESVGGLRERWEALKTGAQAGTLMLTPFELIAQKVGLNMLQRADEILDSYQGVVGATRRAWAAENGDRLEAYIAGYLDALDWVFDPANRSGAEALLAENVPNMTPEIASATCDVYLDPERGLERHGRLDWEGAETALALRSEYGRPQKTLSDPKKYVDLAFYERAAGR